MIRMDLKFSKYKSFIFPLMTNFMGMKILVVDDTPTNIDVLRHIFIDEGFEISIAMNGETALTLVEKSRPDLILLDVMMPGMDGFEICERLKANSRTRDIPVIFVTAKTEVEDIVRGFQVGSVDYITKPFKSEEVLSRVQTHLKIERLIQEKESLNKQLLRQNDELVASQNQYRIMLEKSADGVFRLNTEGKNNIG